MNGRQRALSDGQIFATKSGRSRQIELFGPVACDLLDLYLAQNQPALDTLVFPNQRGGYLNYHNWRERNWRQAIDEAGLDYFRPYDLRHTCATLLIYCARLAVPVRFDRAARCHRGLAHSSRSLRGRQVRLTSPVG